MKKALFIDRDGTLIVEPPVTFQVNTLDELEFLPGVLRNMYFIRKNLDFELVMVSNQDGLGTAAYPEERFKRVQGKMLKTLENEGIVFDNILIDRSWPEDNAPTRKPRTGLLPAYMNGSYDLSASFVIGDRLTDVELAKNIGAKAILLGSIEKLADLKSRGLENYCALIAENWNKIYEFLVSGERTAAIDRKTSETDIHIELNLDGNGKAEISTGLGFFDHMLGQIARHSGCDLKIQVKGDLEVDEHHTIEDTAIALGEAFYKALGSKRGIERYGFALPMDDCSAQVLLDFGGRSWLVWETEFHREKVGEMPTEMFLHFFKSFSDAARCNLNIRAEGTNEHHKIEGIFKAFARAIKAAVKRDVFNFSLPSTKGTL
ncbi:MAG: bifunctional histidinol-phosphatase/imidazoleglycerol-phosphate dehydratase HisB [Bacteroidota bacterium]|nr:bifunctional histidinol-phosphatase/imidazoleglycerol-phosphate dehydratase HisB [Bacteroidota bacterium]MDP4227113.1 bifunctional histidinol-phosphatase/imidazoleglycerol-phosphate dehydratase HisB [Bacteroidota bacterium]MDP4275499.1 bifunctional histidinol-phosphatase/imidazoleglycerol-phosphate dehydratase HisB [Bacteroidota bacterium]